MRALFVGIAAVVLAACDNTPDASFEQAMKERNDAQAGDPYSSLESSMPRLYRYARTQKNERRDYASGQSGQYRATYDELLDKLDGDKDVDRSSELFKDCRAAFAAASSYQLDSGSDASAAAPAREEAIRRLKACRTKAKAAGEPGAVLARFASTGMVIVGAKTAGQGDAETGAVIWGEGEKFVSKDKPGFDLSVKSFRGY